MKAVIIDYGAGNVQSVIFALRRLGVEAELSKNEETIRSADKVIFPGVGEALSAMTALKKQGLNQVIPDLKQPVLGICLGLQLMCDFSSERETECLGIFPGVKVIRFRKDPSIKVPHVGWNKIYDLEHPLLAEIGENPYCYFVHSYFAPVNKFTIATADYQTEFSAVMAKDNFMACQFHPEKSSSTGHRILRNFLELPVKTPMTQKDFLKH